MPPGGSTAGRADGSEEGGVAGGTGAPAGVSPLAPGVISGVLVAGGGAGLGSLPERR